MTTEKPVDSVASTTEQPSRAGKRSVGGHFEPKVAQAIRVLAAQKDTTVQVILAQALNDFFQKNGLERLADEQPLPRGAAARKK
ncbi:ribbon-helix-helix domain-containing protein [Acidocella sp.]|uniref:ribbon-helix-helix domain-containing protein n=1 Tax=Acidocella sp. TaxID=50710 RepID=UPI002623254B|nr:ribbon-helix-helix domain-containing protein [Acidocella sp.]